MKEFLLRIKNLWYRWVTQEFMFRTIILDIIASSITDEGHCVDQIIYMNLYSYYSQIVLPN